MYASLADHRHQLLPLELSSDLVLQGRSHPMEAMGATGVRRLAVVSAAPVAPPNEGEGFLYRNAAKPIVRAIFKESYADLERMEETVRRPAAPPWRSPTDRGPRARSLPAISPQRELPDRRNQQDQPNHARSAGC